MATENQLAFATLLKQYRLAGGLSQEALAERAGLSHRGISALERGISRTPHLDTVTLLARALGLSPEQRAAFLAAARPDSALAPPAPATAPHNLPAQPSPLIGREHDMGAVTTLLQRPEVRLVTLTGPGGVGKTRLAIEVAAHLLEHFADGVFLVSLAPIRDTGLVASVIGQTLGLHELGAQSPTERLLAHVRDKQLLLLLDNFEQLAAAGPLLADLLAASLRLKVLVTSRATMHVRWEHQHAVPPLALPDPDHLPPLDTLAQVPAMALFLQRARAVKADLAYTAETAPAMAAICRQLDGLPLAIELAAARVRLLPPQALLERLQRRLPLLTAGPHDLPDRQQTMRGTIAWSYNLLHSGEQALFRRLAVFAGGCTLEAVEALCQTGSDLVGDLLDWLGALVDQNLLQVFEGGAAAPRFAMLETIREYGLEQLAAHGEEAALRQAHAAYYLALAERAEPELTGPEQGTWLVRLADEHDNLRAALSWSSRQEGQLSTAVQLAGALGQFWAIHGHLSEGRAWLDRVLERESSASTAVRGRALQRAGILAYEQGDYARARALLEETLAVRRGLGDEPGVAATLTNLGVLALYQGDYARSAALHQESLSLARELGNKGFMATALNNLGLGAFYQGDYARAAAYHEESLSVRRMLGDKRGIALSLTNLGWLAYEQSDYARAAAFHEESLSLARELGFREGIARALNNLGLVAYEQGDYARARTLYDESLVSWRELGGKRAIATGLQDMARLAGALRQPERAVALFAAADVLRTAIGAPTEQSLRARNDQVLATARGILGDDAFARAWAAGGALSLEQAIDFALAAGANATTT